MKQSNIVIGSVLLSLLWAGACADNDAQPNPSFETGGKGGSNAQAGKTAVSDAGEPAENGGNGSGGTLTPGGGDGPGSTGGSPDAGAGGAPEVPPYDCVLHPKTHLEIINACTDAQRIEKHPELPAIP